MKLKIVNAYIHKYIMCGGDGVWYKNNVSVMYVLCEFNEYKIDRDMET
jgi:hypothetical protein